jgi:hypothetical protein
MFLNWVRQVWFKMKLKFEFEAGFNDKPD